LLTHIATGDMLWLERFLHRAFAHRRVKLEWFRLTDDEVTLILAIPAAESIDDVPSAVAALYGLNEHNGFRWGEQDGQADLPQVDRGKVFNIRLGEDLETAVANYIALQEVPPDKTGVILTALRKFLAEKGLYPPTRGSN
jgi:hypothetical protein